jgi:hypothetical protein
MCACQGTAQVNVQRDVTASPTPQALPRYRYLYREPYDPRILANTRGEYPVSDSPRRVNTRLAIFQASHGLGVIYLSRRIGLTTRGALHRMPLMEERLKPGEPPSGPPPQPFSHPGATRIAAAGIAPAPAPPREIHMSFDPRRLAVRAEPPPSTIHPFGSTRIPSLARGSACRHGSSHRSSRFSSPVLVAVLTRAALDVGGIMAPEVTVEDIELKRLDAVANLDTKHVNEMKARLIDIAVKNGGWTSASVTHCGGVRGELDAGGETVPSLEAAALPLAGVERISAVLGRVFLALSCAVRNVRVASLERSTSTCASFLITSSDRCSICFSWRSAAALCPRTWNRPRPRRSSYMFGSCWRLYWLEGRHAHSPPQSDDSSLPAHARGSPSRQRAPAPRPPASGHRLRAPPPSQSGARPSSAPPHPVRFSSTTSAKNTWRSVRVSPASSSLR